MGVVPKFQKEKTYAKCVTSRPVPLFHFYCPVDFDALRFGQMRHERVAAQHQQLAKVPVVSVHNLTRNFQRWAYKQQDSPSLSRLLPQIWFVYLCEPKPTGITDERKRVSFAVGLCVTNELVISSASPKQSTFTFYPEKTQTHTHQQDQ